MLIDFFLLLTLAASRHLSVVTSCGGFIGVKLHVIDTIGYGASSLIFVAPLRPTPAAPHRIDSRTLEVIYKLQIPEAGKMIRRSGGGFPCFSLCYCLLGTGLGGGKCCVLADCGQETESVCFAVICIGRTKGPKKFYLVP
jgi:hypothetical protein